VYELVEYTNCNKVRHTTQFGESLPNAGSISSQDNHQKFIRCLSLNCWKRW